MSLLDTSSSEIPDKIACYMHYDRATCMRFTRYGNMLAAGTARSEIALWDVDTHSIAMRLGAPTTKTQAVTSVSFPFPRTGVTVLATHDDGKVRFWDTLAKNMISELDFGVSIKSAEPHPKHTLLAVIVPSDDVPILVELRKGWYEYSKSSTSFSSGMRSAEVPKGAPEEAARQRRVLPHIPPPILLEDEARSLRCCLLTPDAKKKASDKGITYFVRWSNDGTRLIRASSTGFIDTFLLDVDNVRIQHISRCVLGAHGTQILSVSITRLGHRMLISCQDRTLRLMDTKDLMDAGIEASASKPKVVAPLQVFKDVVSGSTWNCSTMSGDGETVAASIESSEQKISLWNASTGMIKCTLEGPLDMVLGMAWHPRRCAMATIAPGGGIYLWERNVSENWSAFASDFVELEANEEYDETEDEFDMPNAEDEKEKAKAREEEEKRIFVDILGNKDVNGNEIKVTVPGAESDDDQAPYFFVPADPEDPYYRGLDKASKQTTNGNGNANGNANGRKKRSRPNGAGSADGTGNDSRDATSPMQTTDTYVNANGHGANGDGAHHHSDVESGRTFVSPPQPQ